MIYILEYAHLNLTFPFISQKTGISLLDTLKNPHAFLHKTELENWADLSNLSSDEDIFGNSSEFLFIDFKNLSLSNTKPEFWKNLLFDKPVFLYSSEQNSFKAEEKKVLKQPNIFVETFKKIDTSTALYIAAEHAKQYNLPENLVTEVSKKSVHYNQIIDSLDFLVLTPNPQECIKEIFTEEKPGLFVYPFRPKTNPKDIDIWKNISEDEIQLAVALIGSKLTKNKDFKTLSKLIQTDLAMKESAKLSLKTWWNLFLWHSLQK